MGAKVFRVAGAGSGTSAWTQRGPVVRRARVADEPVRATGVLNGAMTELWVQRTGPRRYVGHSSRGASVQVGSEDVEGVFTPGELLKIALAACSGMASDVPLARRLGDDYDATVRVSGTADRATETYPVLDETLQLDLSELDADAAQRLLVVAQRAIDRSCTVGRTLTAGTQVNLTIETD